MYHLSQFARQVRSSFTSSTRGRVAAAEVAAPRNLSVLSTISSFPSWSSVSSPSSFFGLGRNTIKDLSDRADSNVELFDQQVRWRSGRSRRGLYDGKDVRFGNNRSHSRRATRRKFKPNVHRKRLFSEILDEMITFRVTCAALKTIDKLGGLDNYLLTSRHVTEGKGKQIKDKILNRLAYLERQKKREEAAAAEGKQEEGVGQDAQASSA